MLYYNRIDLYEGTDVSKTRLFLFLDGVFKHQQDICNGCHDVS